MKLSLLASTLTAAAAMAVPAFSAELIGSWDFTTMTEGTTGSIASSVGSLTLTTGASVTASGSLQISSSNTSKTTVAVSSAGITLEEGISVTMTVEGWSSSSNFGILAAIATDGSSENHDYAAAIGEGGSTTSGGRAGYFMANGGHGSVTEDETLPGLNLSYPMTITLTFVGDVLSIYELIDNSYTLVAQATMNDGVYAAVAGTIQDVAIGSWDGTSTDGEFTGYLNISSLEIYRGDIMAVPEPSMFGLMFGLGAIGLVATRRRKRA